MLLTGWKAAAAVVTFAVGALSAASTDEYRDADQLQSGYLPNHNMDPNIVSSPSFGQLWRVFMGGADTTAGDGGSAEQFMAKPLVYTPLKGGYGGRQVVITCSETNWVYVMDAVNGTIYNKRQLHRPFLASDAQCNDINAQIGITGTPVIDPATDIMYLFSKTYAGAANGFQNGIYYFHAIDVNSLNDVYDPVNVNGGPADNDPYNGIYFTGGTQLQRTSLSLINGAVYAGFGGHCDNFNFTGWVIGMDAPTGHIITRFATEVGPFAPAQDGTNNYKAGGGGSGIWQSGMSLTSDNPSRLYFVTGNDDSHANIELPASGRTPMGTLGEAIVNLAIDPTTRKVSVQDYFEPYEYISMDGGDRDLGSGGICGLDSTVFKGNNVAHIGVTIGKNGKGYVVNMDNLGGFKNGPSGGDLVIQTLPMPGGGPIFGGAGSYPLEGGYIYMTPVGYPTQVYKFVPDAQGNPKFSLVSQTPDNSAGRVGVGPPVITTNGGAAGTAILWVTDVDAGLRAYYAVPQSDGTMKKITMPSTPSINKYQRPAFGDGRLYLSTSNGYIICLGSPVAQPFTCDAPVDFGKVVLGNTSTLQIHCTANIPVTKVTGLTLTNPLFTASNASLPTGSLNTGDTFSFPATFNLSTASVQNSVNTSVPGVKPGVASGAITLYTTNGITGYSTNQPIAVTGQTVSKNGFLSISPVELDFGGLVVNSTAAESGISGTMVISNIGTASLTWVGSAWTDLEDDDALPQNVTLIDGDQYQVGNGFNATSWPQVGYVIPGGQSISVGLNFVGDDVGAYGSLLTVWTTGGNPQNIILAGVMSNAPVMELTVNNGEGGAWQPSITGYTIDPDNGAQITEVGVDFGSLYPGNSSIYTIRVNNTGGSALLITKSKPPEGVELTATNPTGSLPEGMQIEPNGFSDGPVVFQPALASSPPNSDPRTVTGSWTINGNDLNFGVHVVTYTGKVVVPQHGPLNSAGNSVYKYLGCYIDTYNNGPRIETYSTDNGNINENGLCQKQAAAANAIFAATEYHTQCWWGNNIPNSTFFIPESAGLCSWTCPGDQSQPCGGAGGYMNIFYDSTRYNPETGVCNGCNTPTVAPGAAAPGVIVQEIGDYDYVGCYTEANPGRALTGAAFAYDGMTPYTCAQNCTGFSMWGVEYGRECYCGNALHGGSTVAPGGDSECSFVCGGNSTEACGAGGRISLYAINGTVTNSTDPVVVGGGGGGNTGTSLIIVQETGAYDYVGCYTEATNGRALKGAAFAYDSMTPDSCAANCTGFPIFGVEYGRECFCGTTLTSGSVLATNGDSECSMGCGGNSTEACGAGNRLSLYAVNGTNANSGGGSTTTPTGPTIKQTVGSYNFFGCQTEASNGRALSSGAFYNDSMTLESCAASCSGYTYWGTEYGRECYCGNTFQPGSVSTSISDCSMVCSGDSSELCGNGNRLSVYTLNGTAPFSNTTASTSPAAASATPAGPVHVQSVGSYSWIGCYTEATNSRALNQKTLVDYNAMTVEMCELFCSSSSYTMFGLEWSGECYCGNSLMAGSVLANTNDCGNLCDGDSSTYCGGGNRLDMYQLTAATNSSTTTSSSSSTSTSTESQTDSTTSTTSSAAAATTSPAGPVHVQSVGDYSWIGCYTEATNSRALTSASTANFTSMTPEVCGAFCSSGGYSMFGVEWTGECYCGNSLAAGSVLAATNDCSNLCAGSSLEYCGGGNRLDMYSLNSTASAASTTSSTSSTTSSAAAATTTPAGPVHVQAVQEYQWMGCYSEANGQRALNSNSLVDYTNMTVQMCKDFCTPQYSMFGLEYAGECYCGNTLQDGSTLQDTADCNKPCDGAPDTEYCGAGNRLDVYQLSGSSSSSTSSTSTTSSATTLTTSTSSSTTDSTSSSTSSSSSPATTSTDVSSTSSSTSSSSSSAATTSTDNSSPNSFASMANTTSSSSELSTTTTKSSSSSSSSSTTSSSSSSSSSISTTSTTSTTTTSTTSALPTYSSPITLPGNANFSYYSCLSEPPNGRAFLNLVEDNGTLMTVDRCLQQCSQYKYAGLEYGRECWCGDSIADGTGLNATGCDMVCSGNSTGEYCGNGLKLTTYVFNVTKALMNNYGH